MTDTWSSEPGTNPPSASSLPPGWGAGGTATVPEAPPTYGSGPPMPPLPEPQEPRPVNRVAVVVGSLVAVIILLLGLLTYTWVSRDGNVTTAGPTTTAPSSSTTAKPGASSTTAPGSPSTSTPPSAGPSSTASIPPTTAFTGPVPTQADLDAVIAELVPFVETSRGLTFTQRPTATMMASGQFEQQLDASIDATAKADIERKERLFKAAGLFDKKGNLVQVMHEVANASEITTYDPTSKTIIVRAQTITPLMKESLVADLTRALDDQHYDVNRPQLQSAKDESLFGLQALTAGTALRVQALYVVQMDDASRTQAKTEAEAISRRVSAIAANAAPFLANWVRAPGDYGPDFVQTVLAGGGEQQLAKAFASPPTASMLVIHPDRFQRGQAAVTVEKPEIEAGGKEVDDGTVGEALTTVLLCDGVPELAQQAADGWAGDHYVVWQAGADDLCSRIDYKATNADELSELEAAFTKWASKHQGVDVQNKGDVLEVTRCASGGAGRSTL